MCKIHQYLPLFGEYMNKSLELNFWPTLNVKLCFVLDRLSVFVNIRYAVAEWYEAGLCDREVAGSTPARGCCVPTPTQRAIPPGSVNE